MSATNLMNQQGFQFYFLTIPCFLAPVGLDFANETRFGDWLRGIGYVIHA